jgi:mRNA interferase MazF
MPLQPLSSLEAGDVLWIDFGPPFGHEQAGRRPAVVVSPRAHNSVSSLILVCPITRNADPWPFKVPMPAIGRLTGAIMVDQLRAIDPVGRAFRRAGRVPDDTMIEVRGKLAAILEISLSS